MNPLKLALFIAADLVLILCSLNMRDTATGFSLWWSFLGPLILVFAIVSKIVRPPPLWFLNAWLMLFAAWFTVETAELALGAHEYMSPASKITMPADWEIRRVNIPEAPASFYWQNILHEKDSDGFRKIGPWPAKTDRKRIIVIGDSFTYGLGVAKEDAYPAQLQTLLGDRYEVLNLGVPGLNSTQVWQLLEKMTPKLQPDLVIYGMCLNDFLDENEDPAKAKQPYSPPIPTWIRDPLISRTRLGAALDTGYNKLLLTLHLRTTVTDDILKNISERSERFRHEVEGMEAWVHLNNLPPIISMVLDNVPAQGSQNEQLAKLAEVDMEAAGMRVHHTADYYAKYDGKAFIVSPWEGHPNALAHWIFASMFAEQVLEER